MMRYSLILPLGLLLACSTVMADVYRWVDDAGNVIYSDTARDGAEKIQLNETTVVPALKPQRRKRVTERKAENAFAGYDSVRITSPANEETLRNTTGVNVTVEVVPALQSGDQLQLYFDGKAYGKPSSRTNFTVSEVERGSHDLSVAVLDVSGRQLKRSDTSVFFTHRRSIQHAPPGGPAAR
jgi:hypothetical protein